MTSAEAQQLNGGVPTHDGASSPVEPRSNDLDWRALDDAVQKSRRRSRVFVTLALLWGFLAAALLSLFLMVLHRSSNEQQHMQRLEDEIAMTKTALQQSLVQSQEDLKQLRAQIDSVAASEKAVEQSAARIAETESQVKSIGRNVTQIWAGKGALKMRLDEIEDSLNRAGGAVEMAHNLALLRDKVNTQEQTYSSLAEQVKSLQTFKERLNNNQSK